MGDYPVSNKITQLIARDLGMEAVVEGISEKDLLRLVADQVAFYIENRLETLLSLMYRLDVNQAAVEQALSPMAKRPANEVIAELIVERQKERIRTKQKYKQDPLNDIDDELKY